MHVQMCLKLPTNVPMYTHLPARFRSRRLTSLTNLYALNLMIFARINALFTIGSPERLHTFLQVLVISVEWAPLPESCVREIETVFWPALEDRNS
jgi:hypothetical protein